MGSNWNEAVRTMSVTAVAIEVADKSQKVIPGAIVYLKSPEMSGGFLFEITNNDGYAIWPSVRVPFSGTLQLAGAASAYGPGGNGQPVSIPDKQNITLRVGTTGSPQDVTLPPASFRKPVGASPAIHGRLYSNGPRLFDDVGPWKWKMATAFDALRLMSSGSRADRDVLRAYCAWVVSIRGNGLRVFCNWEVTGLDFRTVPDYNACVRRLCELAAEYGLRIELCAVCDYIPPGLTAQQGFIDWMAAVLNDYDHAVLTFGNEPYQNMEDPSLIVQPGAPLLMSRGMCNPNDPSAKPYLPSAGFTTYQTVRSDDWMRKVGKDGWEIRNGFEGFPGTHDATINTEMMGAAETYQPGRRSNRPAEFFMAGVAAGMFTSGATAHGDSQTMQWCRVPGPIEAECARQLFRGIDMVPIDTPTWNYARYGPSAPPFPMPVEPDPIDGDGDQVRMHSMIGPTHAVSINYRYLLPGHDAWRPQGVNGWKSVAQDGPFVLSERSA